MLTSHSRAGRQNIFFAPAPFIHYAIPLCLPSDTLERANGFPQIAIDPKSRRLYVTWTDYRNGDLDVFCSTSTDGREKRARRCG